MSIYRDISDLHNWDKNPRSSTDENIERLIKQIKKLGVYKPLLITEDGTVLGGNMRLKALNKMGEKKVWVSIVDAPTDEKKIEYALSDNDRVGKYEEDQLKKLIGEYPDVSWGDYSVDIKEPELVSDFMDSFKEVEEDEAPAVETGPAESKLGEIYQLGRHRVMCGDSTKIKDVEKLMDGKKADMVFTDPPYGVDYEGGHNKKKRLGIDNDKLQGTDLTQLFHDAIANAVVMSKDYSAFYIWYASGKSVETFASFVGLGLELRAVIQWYKVHSGLGAFMSQYIPNCEPCMYAHKPGRSPQWFGASDEKTVWELKREGKSEFHPTQKPIELCARAIKNSSKTDDIVLDLFLGSGSTLIACEQTNRICYGMELDPKYVDVIRKRYAKFINKEAEWQKITPVINT